MSETEAQGPNNAPKLRWEMISLHCIQFGTACIVLVLACSGVSIIAYNALIYSIIVAVCTLLVCIYLISAQIFHKRLYIPWIILLLHLWMILFWFANMGVVANLALSQGPPCSNKHGNGFICKASTLPTFSTRDFTTLYGTLVAGSVLATLEIILWSTTALLPALHARTHLSFRNFRALFHFTAVRRFTMTPPPSTPNLPVPRRSSIPAQMQATASTGSMWDQMAPGASRHFAEPLIPEDSESERAGVDGREERPVSRSGVRSLLGAGGSVRTERSVEADESRGLEAETPVDVEGPQGWRVVNGAPESPASPPPRLEGIELHDVSLRD